MTVFRKRIAGLNDEQVMHAMGIDDAYKVERVLARGPHGVTECVTIEGAGPFIRKKIPLSRANRAVWAALATNTCARLPQVAATYEMPDWFVAVYDYVPGESLEALVQRSGALSDSDAVQLTRDVCEALEALHACGIMHLDIAPSNIEVAADGAHLVDFGNAQMINGRGTQGKASERPLGTWGFAAPEQFFSKADARSDIYAAGRVLGYMLTGIFPDEENQAAYEAALADAGAVDAHLRAVVERACAFEPSARYQTAGEFAAALDSSGKPAAVSFALGSGTPASPAAEAPVRVEASKGNVHRVLLAAGALLVICVAVGAFLLIRGGLGSFGGAPVASSRPGVNAPASTDRDGVRDPIDNASDSGAVGDGTAAARAAKALHITESGWTVDSNGYVLYGVSVANESDDLTVDYVEVGITGRAEDGSVVFSDTQTMGTLFPGQTLTFGNMAGNGTVPARVEFSVARPSDYAVRSEKGTPSKYEVTGTTAKQDNLGSTIFTGEVALVEGGDELPLVGDGVWLSIVFRDDKGAIVSGCPPTFVKRPAKGERMPFEISVYGCPDYASFEVNALSW